MARRRQKKKKRGIVTQAKNIKYSAKRQWRRHDEISIGWRRRKKAWQHINNENKAA